MLPCWPPFPLEDSVTEERKFAILFAATILAARKLSDPDLKPWPRAAAIRDAINSAEQILEEIDAKCGHYDPRTKRRDGQKCPTLLSHILQSVWMEQRDKRIEVIGFIRHGFRV